MNHLLYSSAPSIVRETARGLSCIHLEDELLRSREIFLTEEVHAASMNALLKQLLYLHREDPEQEITLYINSPGGEVRSGLAVYDFMRMVQTPIRTVCVGTAASMAAILFLAGQKREMLPHAQLMIHDPSPGGGSIAGMKPDQMQEHLGALRQTQKILCDIVTEVSGLERKQVSAAMKKDTFYSAEEAIRLGLATGVVSDFKYRKE